jgi:hypothetical protein
VSIAIPIHTIKERIQVNDDITLEIQSTPSLYGEYPDFKISQYCHIDIIAKNAHSIGFFYGVIYKLLLFFTIIGYGKCKIHGISTIQPIKYEGMTWESNKRMEFYNNHLNWDIDKEQSHRWFVMDNMLYHTIKEDFPKAIKMFFETKPVFHNIINFVADMNEVYAKQYLQVFLSQQVQMLEIYGNIKLQGSYTDKESVNRQDLRETIFSQIPDDVFDKICIHNYKDNNYRGWENFGADREKSISELKGVLFTTLTELRNFIIHPYKKGAYKRLGNTVLSKYYYINDEMLNMEAVSSLSISLKRLLRWFLYKEIGLEKYFEI